MKKKKSSAKAVPSSSEPSATSAPETRGWYRNEKGEACFAGACFSLKNSHKGFEIEFDESCDVQEAAEAHKGLTMAALEGAVTMSTRRK